MNLRALSQATEDGDLKILYRLNDRIMGSVIPETAALTADIYLEDGSADAIGLVEVVTDGGEVVSSVVVPDSMGEISLEIPAGGSYYYLRISREGHWLMYKLIGILPRERGSSISG